MRAAKVNMKQTDTNRSMAVTYDTFGRDFLDMVLRVVMVSTVVIPKPVKTCNCVKNASFYSFAFIPRLVQYLMTFWLVQHPC